MRAFGIIIPWAFSHWNVLESLYQIDSPVSGDCCYLPISGLSWFSRELDWSAGRSVSIMPLLGGSMAREFAAGRENGKGVCCWEGDAARVQFTPPNPPGQICHWQSFRGREERRGARLALMHWCTSIRSDSCCFHFIMIWLGKRIWLRQKKEVV